MLGSEIHASGSSEMRFIVQQNLKDGSNEIHVIEAHLLIKSNGTKLCNSNLECEERVAEDSLIPLRQEKLLLPECLLNGYRHARRCRSAII